LARQQGRIILCGVVCVTVALAANQIWPTGELKSPALIAPLLTKVALALVAYVIAARFLARPELRDVVRISKALFHRQRPSIPAS
jgi:hypothetical protein